MKRRWKIGIGAAFAALVFPVYWVLTICHHDFTRPFTRRLSNGDKETYCVCTKCGKEFEFDLKTMQVGKKLEK